MRPQITIRPATPDDALGIALVQKAAWRATYPNEAAGVSLADINTKTADWDSPPMVASIRERIEQAPAETRRWVATEGDVIVGQCVVTKGETEHHLDMLYVLPPYHRRRVGYRLAKTGLAWLGDSKPVALEVVTYNRRAIAFYERLGFRRTGETLTDLDIAQLPSGASMMEYRMVRPAPVQ